MSGLSDEAINVLTIVKEMETVDQAAFKTLEQLFANRLSDDLTQTLVDGKEQSLAETLFKVVSTVKAAESLGYTLRFLSDLVQVCPTVAAIYAASTAAQQFGEDPCQRFLDLGESFRTEAGIARPALFLAAAVLRATAAGERESCVRGFLAHVRDVFSVQDLAQCRDLEFTVHAISVFVKEKSLRQRFLEAGLVKELPRTLTYVCENESSSMVQLMYEALLACWILSYDYGCLAQLQDAKLLAVLHKTIQRAIKEKCIRMAILVLKNFSGAQAAVSTSENVGHVEACNALVKSGEKLPNYHSDMIGIGMLKTLSQLQRKKYGDEDITKDLDALVQTLESNLDELTSFSEYKGEVDSKVLEWSPVHTSAKFWKENARKFESNHYDVLKNLVELLDSNSETTVAVACHDIGELVRFHPNGRNLLSLPVLGNPKPKIMHLMTHPNQEVARNALLAVQKIMVQKWEFLQN